MRLIFAAVLLGSSTVASLAQSDPAINLLKKGYWEAFYSKSADACGMSSFLGYGGITVKHFAGNTNLTVQVFKKGWQFPREKTSIPMLVGFDNEPHLDGNGAGYNPSGISMGMVEFNVRPEGTKDFLDRFRKARTMWMQFKEGTEAPWSLSLVGSQDVAVAFARCIVARADAEKSAGRNPTQPYNSKPPSNRPTQPFRESSPSPSPRGPTGPPVKLTPAKRDDGSI